MMRSKVWLVMLAACGIALTACDKEDDELAPAGGEPTSSATFQDKPSDIEGNIDNNNGDNNGGVNNPDEFGNNEDESFNSKPSKIADERSISGNYVVSYLALASQEMTQQYSGVTVSMHEGFVSVSGSRGTTTGTYQLVGSNNVRLLLSDRETYSELDNAWKITEFTDSYVAMVTPWVDAPRYQLILTRVQ